MQGMPQATLHTPTLTAKLAFLQRQDAYGENTRALQCLETHMSWVFLLEHQVYKLKKPVCLSYLDFSTLQAREFYCREEVRLNARMAPGIYLGVVALTWDGNTFRLVPDTSLPALGDTVDWLVHMRRVPHPRMLLQLISRHQVKRTDMAPLIELLTKFYRTAPLAPLSEDDYLARFRQEQACNREVLLHPRFGLPQAEIGIEHLDHALTQCTPLLRKRVRLHHVVDGHGDLRPDHVFLLHPPVVIDCLEFNASLRQVDPMEEMSYLSLECDMVGAGWLGQHVTRAVAKALGDVPPLALLHFYTAHRALLRARLALAHLLDPQPRTPHNWQALANQYLACSLKATEVVSATQR